MSTHNIQFHHKIRQKILNMCFLELSEEGTQKLVRSKRASGVRVIEVLLYITLQ